MVNVWLTVAKLTNNIDEVIGIVTTEGRHQETVRIKVQMPELTEKQIF
jgi:hypothetical protein